MLAKNLSGFVFAVREEDHVATLASFTLQWPFMQKTTRLLSGQIPDPENIALIGWHAGHTKSLRSEFPRDRIWIIPKESEIDRNALPDAMRHCKTVVYIRQDPQLSLEEGLRELLINIRSTVSAEH